MADNRSLRFGTKKAELHACKKRKMVENVVVVKLEINDKRPEGPPPSDSWSWRKYGQKPIKGSPFPRGYYRCSTFKGCTAKKQVERCKTDSSKLIITYTSTHNHPFTQISKDSEESSSSVFEKLPKTITLEEELEREQKPLERTDISPLVEQTVSQFDVIEEGNCLVKKVDVAYDSLEITCKEYDSSEITCKQQNSPNAEDGDDIYDELGELPTPSCLTKLVMSNFFDERILVEPF